MCERVCALCTKLGAGGVHVATERVFRIEILTYFDNHILTYITRLAITHAFETIGFSTSMMGDFNCKNSDIHDIR